jgi:hypothetical protein
MLYDVSVLRRMNVAGVRLAWKVPFMGEGELAFFGLFGAFAVLVILGICWNLGLFPPL